MANIAKRSNGQWRARYRDARGKEHARHFNRKIDAQNWLDSVTAAIQTGTYVDPSRSRVTVGAMAEQWFDGKVSLRPTTRALYESVLSNHVLPRWRDVPLTTSNTARCRRGSRSSWPPACRPATFGRSTASSPASSDSPSGTDACRPTQPWPSTSRAAVSVGADT